MYNHAPEGYNCPFCRLVSSQPDPGLISAQDDIFYRDEHLTAMISLHTWAVNSGNALIFPNQHYENLYDLPDEIGARVFALSRRVALAMKAAYGCEGVSTRQHNEPAGNQDVWHYHLHVFPRYPGDNLYTAQRVLVPPEERGRYAAMLRAQMAAK